MLTPAGHTVLYAAAVRAEIEAAAPHALVTLTDKPYGVALTILSVPAEHRRQGQAAAALRALTAAADRYGFTLSLTPDSCFGTPTKILHRMYLDHGFTFNHGRARDYAVLDSMIRYPNVTSTA